LKEKNKVKKIGKCQLIFSYVLIVLGLISLVQCVFMIYAMDRWSSFEVRGKDGIETEVNIDKDDVFVITGLKAIASLLMILWGKKGIKVFKPISNDSI